MLFDMTASTNSRKTVVLNPDFPKDITVSEGTNAVFTAAIAENGRPKEYTYQWYVNGEAVPGAVNQTYTRDSSGDKGVYSVYCTVSNKAGTITSRVATMVVNKKPVLNASYPENTTVTVGNSVTAKVSISEDGYPTNYSYQWYKNGSAVSGATSSSYTFDPSVGSTSVYCIVTNAAGTVTTRTATITANPLHLFNAGDQCTAVTGGWTNNGFTSTGSFPPSDVCGTFNDGTWIYCTGWDPGGGDYGRHGVMATAKKIDLSKYKTLHCYGYAVENGGTAHIAVCSGTAILDTIAASGRISTSEGWVVVDISGLTGSYYISLVAYSSGATAHARNIRLE